MTPLVGSASPPWLPSAKPRHQPAPTAPRCRLMAEQRGSTTREHQGAHHRPTEASAQPAPTSHARHHAGQKDGPAQNPPTHNQFGQNLTDLAHFAPDPRTTGYIRPQTGWGEVAEPHRAEPPHHAAAGRGRERRIRRRLRQPSEPPHRRAAGRHPGTPARSRSCSAAHASRHRRLPPTQSSRTRVEVAQRRRPPPEPPARWGRSAERHGPPPPDLRGLCPGDAIGDGKREGEAGG